MGKIKVMDCQGDFGSDLNCRIVARVKTNSNLDYLDERNNWTNGGAGRHLGITQLKSTRQYVLIYGTDHQDEFDQAYTVTDHEALQAILKSGHKEMLFEKKFERLKNLGIEKGILTGDKETDMKRRVNVHEDDECRPYTKCDVVACVEYNSVLDIWDGHNWSNGGVGEHLGLTKLDDVRYVLIYGTQRQGKPDYGIIISPQTAATEIYDSGNLKLFETYPELEKYTKFFHRPPYKPLDLLRKIIYTDIVVK